MADEPRFPAPGERLVDDRSRAAEPEERGPYRAAAELPSAARRAIDASDVEWVPRPGSPVDARADEPAILRGAVATDGAPHRTTGPRPPGDVELARLLAATAAMKAPRTPSPWRRRLIMAPTVVLSWLLRGWLGTAAWLVMSVALVVLVALEVRAAWRRSALDF
jgi:hypothetical protein